METIRVWTKQHISVWEILEREGVYYARSGGIFRNEDARLMAEAYRWLAENTPGAAGKPEGAELPIWLAFSRAGTMLPTPDTVLLELEIDPGLITHVNIAKWGTILNFSYIPADPQDKNRHTQLLRDWGTSDEKAYMTQFYPQIKREIQASWTRLFDDSIQVGSPECYGTIWEVRKEWVRNVEIL